MSKRIKHFFKEIHRGFRLQRMFAALHLKKLMEYKIDFLTGAIGFLLEQAVNIAFLSIVFGRVENLRGWNYYEVLFIYGFSLFPNGLDHLFFDNIWNVAYWMVRKGEFDKYLTRPINTLLIVTVEEFQVDAFGKRSIAFWTKRSGHIVEVVYNINQFSQYPVSIYSRIVRGAVTYIIPFALTSYYPASYLLRHTQPVFSNLAPMAAAAALISAALIVWHKGLDAYESAGS